MDFLSAAAIGVALAMDAVAVSISCGSINRNSTLKFAIIVAFTFGFFQFLMPILGWSVGKVGKNFVEEFDHWIAFIILCILGIKMIYESRHENDHEISTVSTKSRLRTLVIMAFATSIDALATGIVLPTAVGAETPFTMFLTVSIIGIITFLLSLAGFFAGKCLRMLSSRKAEMFGGIVLILIGVKTLLL